MYVYNKCSKVPSEPNERKTRGSQYVTHACRFDAFSYIWRQPHRFWFTRKSLSYSWCDISYFLVWTEHAAASDLKWSDCLSLDLLNEATFGTSTVTCMTKQLHNSFKTRWFSVSVFFEKNKQKKHFFKLLMQKKDRHIFYSNIYNSQHIFNWGSDY